MEQINFVKLAGHLGKDPVIKTFESGTKRATILLATNEQYKNSLGKTIETIQWHRVTAWGALAEKVARNLHKGTRISLEGKLHQYTVNLGEAGKRVYHEITIDCFDLLFEQPRAL